MVTGATLIQCPQGTTKLPTEVVEVASSDGVVQSTYVKRGRKGVSTVVTKKKTAASTRLERVVVSVGLGPLQSSRLAREPTRLQRGVVFLDSDPRWATTVRRGFYSWRESSSRTRVESHTLAWREGGSCGP